MSFESDEESSESLNDDPIDAPDALDNSYLNYYAGDGDVSDYSDSESGSESAETARPRAHRQGKQSRQSKQLKHPRQDSAPEIVSEEAPDSAALVDSDFDAAEETPEPRVEFVESEGAREIIIVRSENRITSDILSKFEMTEIISARGTSIARNNDCFVSIEGLESPIDMAKRELMMRMCPLIVRRYVGDRFDEKKNKVLSYYEYWNPNEMQHQVSYNSVTAL